MSRSETVWIVDDDRSIRWVLEKALQQEGMTTVSFENADSVIHRLGRQQPDVIISDIRMPGSSGLDLLAQIRELHPRLPVIIMTAHSDLDSAVASYQGGAFEYLPKPFDVDEAVSLVKRANQHAQEQQGLEAPANQARTPEIIGEAPAMQEVFRAIGRLSHSNITVLINGESGTGKELVAHALHRHSPRGCVASRHRLYRFPPCQVGYGIRSRASSTSRSRACTSAKRSPPVKPATACALRSRTQAAPCAESRSSSQRYGSSIASRVTSTSVAVGCGSWSIAN